MTPSTPIDKEQIYLTYYPKVLQYARSHMANVHEAEDLAQNVFLKVYAKLDTFDSEKSALSTWIFNITRNSVIDHYRASASKKHEELTEMISDGSTGLAENLIMEEQQEMLADALSQLTGPERDVILLRFYKNYTLVQISSMMKLSYEQTKRLQTKALRKLAMLMQGGEELPGSADKKPRPVRSEAPAQSESSGTVISLFDRRRKP